MNQIIQVTHCEQCGAMITLESPPSKERYERAGIHVTGFSVLLPKRVVSRKHKAGFADSHAATIEGYFCSPPCFVKKLEQILGNKIIVQDEHSKRK